jgi:hypothetical protein
VVAHSRVSRTYSAMSSSRSFCLTLWKRSLLVSSKTRKTKHERAAGAHLARSLILHQLILPRQDPRILPLPIVRPTQFPDQMSSIDVDRQVALSRPQCQRAKEDKERRREIEGGRELIPGLCVKLTVFFVNCTLARTTGSSMGEMSFQTPVLTRIVRQVYHKEFIYTLP